MRAIISILIITLVFSCNGPENRIEVVEDKNLTQEQIDSVLNEYNFEYDRVQYIDSTSFALLPISTQRPRGGSRYSKDYYKADSYPKYWNLIFYDFQSNKSHLLTKSKIRISHFSINMKEVGPLLSKSILYEIANTDYNRDGKLTYEDPEQLFLSKNDGTGLKRLSPKNEHLLEFHTVPDTDILLIKTRRDVNNDLEFYRNDEVIWYKLDLSKDEQPIEILNEGKRKEIENLYFEQWLLKDSKDETE